VAVTLLYSCGRDLWEMNLICSDQELAVVLLKGPSLLLLIHWLTEQFVRKLDYFLNTAV